MREAYFLNIYGVPTKVVTWGRWVEESNLNDEPKDIILCIPGNPGVTAFYKEFLSVIHEKTGYPVWLLSHAGHELPEEPKSAPPLTYNETIYGLQGQVNHKLAFIQTYVPKNSKIHFIGHSTGAYIILQLLKDPSIQERTVKSYLLFPAIENMSDTANGKILTYIVKHFVWLILFLSWIFTLFPSFLRIILIKIFILCSPFAVARPKTLKEFVRPIILEKVFYLAFDKMDLVKERDTEILNQNKDKIKLYYGATDNWQPPSYFKKLKMDIPDIDAQMCDQNFKHAFNLINPEEMGNVVVSWIKH